jgi:polyhydroxyalkanoate synthesis regulator phasin
MKMIDESEELQLLRVRLLEELAQLEQMQQQLDLRDRSALDACHRKLDALRRQIARLDAGSRKE